MLSMTRALKETEDRFLEDCREVADKKGVNVEMVDAVRFIVSMQEERMMRASNYFIRGLRFFGVLVNVFFLTLFLHSSFTETPFEWNNLLGLVNLAFIVILVHESIEDGVEQRRIAEWRVRYEQWRRSLLQSNVENACWLPQVLEDEACE